MKYNR